MTRRLDRTKGRKSGHSFLALPHHMLNHESYLSLSYAARAMLTEVAIQYNGKNNGDLCATLKLLKPRGWTSNATITKSVRELVEKGFLQLTRQGGRKIPNLYAITWQSIDECNGKLETPPTKVASNDWKRFRFSLHHKVVHTAPGNGAKEGSMVVPLHQKTVQ